MERPSFEVNMIENYSDKTERFREIVEQAMRKLMPGFSPVAV